MFDVDFKIPPKIRITSRKSYKVLNIDKFEIKEKVGETDFTNKTVTLKKDLEDRYNFFVFFHEMIHVISDHKNLKLTEKQVEGIEMEFARICKLNKWC